MTIWPSSVLRTSRTSPLPSHCGQVDRLGALLGAAALAGLAGIERGEAELLLGAVDGLVEGQLQVVAEVRAGRPPGAAGGATGGSATEEGVEDVAEALEAAEGAVALRAGTGAAHAGPAEHVVLLAALRIGEDLVGLVDLLEARVSIRVGVDVGVPLLGQLPEGALDLFVAGAALKPQDLVVVAGRGHAMPEYREGRPDAPVTAVPSTYARRPWTPIAVSAAAARRFLVQRHLLAPARAQAAGLDGVRAVFERLGSIQFDPLAVAGRNHDLVLHARVRDYDPAWTNELLYERRELFETYNKMLSLLPTSELPWHRQTWDRFLAMHEEDAFVRHRETMDHVLERIRAEGPLSSLDFERRAKVDWYWGPTSEVRAVLEALSEAGIVEPRPAGGQPPLLRPHRAPLSRRAPGDPARPDRAAPPQAAVALPGPRAARRGRRLHAVVRHRPGTSQAARPARHHHPHRAARGPGRRVARSCRSRSKASAAPATCSREELADLERAEDEIAAGRPLEGASVGLPRAARSAGLGPRPAAQPVRLRLRLGGLRARAKRRWGYYVLPLLWGDRLVGRIEPRIDRGAGAIRILGIWWQDGFARARGLRRGHAAGPRAYARFGGVSASTGAPRPGSASSGSPRGA